MNDDRKDPASALGDLDWDAALDEWEKSTFVPEMAPDAESNRAVDGHLAAATPDAESKKPTRPPEATPSDSKAPRALTEAEPDPELYAKPEDPPSLTKLAAEGTLIAKVPRELEADALARPRPSVPPRLDLPAPRIDSARPSEGPLSSRGSGVLPPPPSRRGGLGQLFARRDSVLPPPTPPPPPSGHPRPPIPRPPSEKTRAAAPIAIAKQTTAKMAPASFEPKLEAKADDDVFTSVRDESDWDRVLQPARIDSTPNDSEPAAIPVLGGHDEDDDEFDPENKLTVVADRSRFESLVGADTATRHPAEEEAPTLGRPSAAPSGAIASEPPAPNDSTGADEKLASRWLDKEQTEAYRVRAAWLEEEARAIEDPAVKARSLLGISEILAIAGDHERALGFAIEARDLAPDLALAWRQARQLMAIAGGADADMLIEALDAEAEASPTPPSRAHATLLAADLLRTTERGDAAVERWESACKLEPGDVRAPIARAALALAQDDHSSGALRLAENSELIALDRAVTTALRLRGVERPGDEAHEMPVNDGLRHARAAFAAGDVAGAARAAAEIGKGPALSKAASWLSAALGSVHIAGRRGAAKALKTLTSEGELLARRQLAARGIELGDPELVEIALAEGDAFDPAERAAILALAGKDTTTSSVALAGRSELTSLIDALAALSLPGEDPDEASSRATRVAGSDGARALTTLGRLLAAGADGPAIDRALAQLDDPRSPSATGVAIEAAVRGRRFRELSESLTALPEGEDASSSVHRYVAAAIVAERANERALAAAAWKKAALAGSTQDGVLRIAAALDPEIDLSAELLRIADELPEGPPAALLRLEAIAKKELPLEEQAQILERVHRAAPNLGLGAFLAERIGRQRGDLDEVLRWIQERRANATDPLEAALDAVREALLVADRDPEVASTRLEEAATARPDDVALRELFERLAIDPPSDRAAWRETRASAATSRARVQLWLEAALEHERAGDAASALAAARKATEGGDQKLSRVLVDRCEIDTGATERQTDELLARTKTLEDAFAKREALERLAELDGVGKKDPAAALLWHRAVLEDSPEHKPSLRFLEHALSSGGRDDELEPVFEQIARVLPPADAGEITAHAQHAARLRAREGARAGSLAENVAAWERTRDLVEIAASQADPSVWSLRAKNAHARARKDEEAILQTTLALLERTQRPSERAALLLRASEAAARLEQVAEARAYLEQAANEDPGDVVTWGFLAEVRERAGEVRAAGEACESLARTSVVRDHQLLAWHDAAKLWLDEVKDPERAMSALEAAAEIDPNYADIFQQLSALYTEKRLDGELARLLERRLSSVEDEDERVGLEVELARAHAEMGELAAAKKYLDSALAERPDHTTALAALAELSRREGDWSGAEQAYVRLARLLSDPEEQREIYDKLGEIYDVHAPNLSRAEVAYREVLKRAPNDLATQTKLVDVYRRQGDVGNAVEIQQEIIAAATDPAVRLEKLIELASLYELVGRDPRRSEQVLDGARKEFPTSVVALRAMAEFYGRQRQMPAMQILLDRAAGDARRAFAQGRFVPALFEVLHAAYELRGRSDAARVVAATLAAVEGQPAELLGGEARAVDPRLDDVLAPDLMSPALRALLYRAGDALDAAAPIDLRMLRAQPLQPGTPIGATVGAVATVVGLGALQILVSPQLGRVAVPLSSYPPTLLVGEGLMRVPNERAGTFVVVRAVKMILSRASALLRGAPEDVAILASALFTAFNPSFTPQGVDGRKVAAMSQRLVPALPRNLDPTVGVIALEAAGMLGERANHLSAAATAWANRCALVAVGDPNAALDAIAWAQGEELAPKDPEERAAWIARNTEARELMTFSVTDAYSEARIRLGLDR